MNRSGVDIPPVPENVSLIQQVEQQDRDIFRKALREAGVSVKTIDKLKSLDGLAINGGRLLTTSLQMTHQNFIGQHFTLTDVADDLRKRMDETDDPEQYAALARVWIECAKEAGKGYKLMLEGTEAQIRMMAAAKGHAPSEAKSVAGWGPMKKVRDVK